MNTRPTLETVAELYKAADAHMQSARRGMDRVVESARRHASARQTGSRVAQALGATAA